MWYFLVNKSLCVCLNSAIEKVDYTMNTWFTFFLNYKYESLFNLLLAPFCHGSLQDLLGVSWFFKIQFPFAHDPDNIMYELKLQKILSKTAISYDSPSSFWW